ncbi:hypothetical protein ACFX2I_003518 [Malus domestica]
MLICLSLPIAMNLRVYLIWEISVDLICLGKDNNAPGKGWPFTENVPFRDCGPPSTQLCHNVVVGWVVWFEVGDWKASVQCVSHLIGFGDPLF